MGQPQVQLPTDVNTEQMSDYRQSEISLLPRVWIVAPSPPPHGGMSVQAEKLQKRLAGEGIAAELIATNPPPPRSLKSLAQMPVIRTVLREIQYLISLGRIVRGPGVVHHFSASYAFFFLHSAPLLLLGKCSPAKVVLNYRGGKAAEFLRTWSWLTRPLLTCAHQIAVPSEFLQRVFADFGLAATVLPNLADTELFPFVDRKQFSPRLFVSRNLEPIYDIECVLRAFRTVQEEVPQAELSIAGEGSESDRLRRCVQRWGLCGVTFCGAVPHQQLPALYQRHDVYVNASRVDNFPGALLEAACAGLPIVTTRAGGIPEMIRHRDNGLLCDVGNDRQLANCILEILHHQNLARQLARHARSWVEQFAWHNVFPHLLRCYGFASDQTTGLREQLLAH